MTDDDGRLACLMNPPAEVAAINAARLELIADAEKRLPKGARYELRLQPAQLNHRTDWPPLVCPMSWVHDHDMDRAPKWDATEEWIRRPHWQVEYRIA